MPVVYAASPHPGVHALSQELRTFFSSLLQASRGTDPIIESGNKYGKTDVSHRMNGELLMLETKASERFRALSAADQTRMAEILEVVLLDDELRNRNPLHASLIDATVIGNLMNFPMHIFGFPYASYATAHRPTALRPTASCSDFFFPMLYFLDAFQKS